MKRLPRTRRDFLRTMALGAAAAAVPLGETGAAVQPKRKNVLFIAVDDLRPQLGCYGNGQMISPRIDRLARDGILFERAYCQQPICMATRASLFSGYRPDHARIYNCDPLQSLAPDALTLNRHFERNGYALWATGKLYHYVEDHEAQFGSRWVNPDGPWVGSGYITDDAIAEVRELEKAEKAQGISASGKGPAYEMADVPDNAYADGAKTDLAIERLRRFQKGDRPFFMAVGYKKPHLPFVAPIKYWDMYPPGKIKLADNPFLPANATEYTAYNFSELRSYAGIPKDDRVLDDALSRKLIQGYCACVTYVDTQIGRLLDALDRLSLRESTVIVLWGDHGWKLGEHGMWCKHTPFELDCRVPMIFSAPGTHRPGTRTAALSEYVDIYPTLCELCGLEIPGHLEGDSLVPLFRNPARSWKKAAFTQWPKIARRDPEKVITGYSLKTDRYRYTEWTRNKTGEVLAREMYDHRADPKENVNIAGLAENNARVSELHGHLGGGKGWQKLRPQR